MRLAVLVALPALLARGSTQAPHAPEPGPRAAVAGLAGFQSVSRLDFGSGANRLTALYVFPDRARWHFEDYAAREGSEHLFLYRHGERVHQLAGGPSQSLDGAERDALLLQMELRRAAMLWPDGFAWGAPENGTRSAPVPADSCCRTRLLGTLVATLADDRPVRVEARDVQGRPLEALAIRAWQESHGRTWPRTLVMEVEGGGFVETVESIETGVHYLDLSFVPPDRRASSGASATEPSLLAQDLVPTTYAAHGLPAGVSWEEALTRARAWMAAAGEAGKASGRAVDPTPTFELAEDGRPVRCLVRLSVALVPAPAGYQTQPERPGLLLALDSLEALEPAMLARLRQAVPKGATPGVAYLRVHDRPAFPVELVLPLEPAD